VTSRPRAIVEVVLAIAAAVGCVVSFFVARTPVSIPPVAEGEPSVPSVTFYPPLLMLALVFGTLAGVLVVVGVARWRRYRISEQRWGPFPADDQLSR
jgi:H+/Cl- antiporter ClcA